MRQICDFHIKDSKSRLKHAGALCAWGETRLCPRHTHAHKHYVVVTQSAAWTSFACGWHLLLWQFHLLMDAAAKLLWKHIPKLHVARQRRFLVVITDRFASRSRATLLSEDATNEHASRLTKCKLSVKKWGMTSHILRSSWYKRCRDGFPSFYLSRLILFVCSV